MNKLIKVVLLLVVSSLFGGCATYNYSDTEKNSQSGDVGYIARGIHPIGTPENIEAQAMACVEGLPEWEDAGAAERKRILEYGRERMRQLGRTHEVVQFADVGVFLSHHTSGYFPIGTIRHGDEVAFRAAPIEKAWGVRCGNHDENGNVLVLDRIVKHHTGTLLYKDGGFIGTVDE